MAVKGKPVTSVAHADRIGILLPNGVPCAAQVVKHDIFRQHGGYLEDNSTHTERTRQADKPRKCWAFHLAESRPRRKQSHRGRLRLHSISHAHQAPHAQISSTSRFTSCWRASRALSCTCTGVLTAHVPCLTGARGKSGWVSLYSRMMPAPRSNNEHTLSSSPSLVQDITWGRDKASDNAMGTSRSSLNDPEPTLVRPRDAEPTAATGGKKCGSSSCT